MNYIIQSYINHIMPSKYSYVMMPWFNFYICQIQKGIVYRYLYNGIYNIWYLFINSDIDKYSLYYIFHIVLAHLEHNIHYEIKAYKFKGKTGQYSLTLFSYIVYLNTYKLAWTIGMDYSAKLANHGKECFFVKGEALHKSACCI